MLSTIQLTAVEGFAFPLDGTGTVFPPTSDATHRFLRLIRRPLTGEVLDLGTGSGLLALIAHRDGATVTASDCNKDAICYARRTAILNNRRGIRWRVGPDFEPFSRATRFDRILAHLPFLPSADAHGLAFADGGPTGHETADRLLATAHHYLRHGGMLELLGVWPPDQPPVAAFLTTTIHPILDAPHGRYTFVRAVKE